MKPRYLVALIAGMAVLYPLSIGPVMARERQMAGAPSPVPGFYKPLMQLSKASPAFRDLLMWYLQCWGLPVNNHPREKKFHS
jgi:hypothetical protein